MKGEFNNQRGFTLVEIMMVVIIIGILAVLAIPRYQKYTLESKLSEVAVAVGEIKTGVAKYYNSHGNKYTTIPAVTGNRHLQQALRIDLGDQKNFRFAVLESQNNNETGFVVYGILTGDGVAAEYGSATAGMQVTFCFPRSLLKEYTSDPDWSKGWNDESFFR